MYDVIIVGSGPAGFTAAIYTTRANLKTLVLAGTKWGGQLMLTTEVENYPGFPQGIQGPELMKKFRDQAERFGAQVIDKLANKVDFSHQPFKIYTDEQIYQGRSVIVATGADTRWLEVPGEQRLIGKGVSSCAPCDAFFFKDKKVIVVGGGDSAMEEALVLTKFASSVTVVHRRDQLRASKIMQNRAFNNDKISWLWNTRVVEVLGEQKIEAVKLVTHGLTEQAKRNYQEHSGKQFDQIDQLIDAFGGEKLEDSSSEETKASADEVIWRLPIEGMFVAIGHLPNTKIFKDSGLSLDEKGYVKRLGRKDENTGLMKYWSATNIDGVFVAGDVHDYHYRQAITAAGFGCMAAMDAERWLENSFAPGETVDMVKK